MGKLKYVNGAATMTATSSTFGEKIWESAEGVPHSHYYIVGTFNDWQLEMMQSDESKEGVFRFYVTVGENWQEEFQIIVDGDWAKTMYPQVIAAEPGTVNVMGP